MSRRFTLRAFYRHPAIGWSKLLVKAIAVSGAIGIPWPHSNLYVRCKTWRCVGLRWSHFCDSEKCFFNCVHLPRSYRQKYNWTIVFSQTRGLSDVHCLRKSIADVSRQTLRPIIECCRKAHVFISKWIFFEVMINRSYHWLMLFWRWRFRLMRQVQ